MPKKAPILLLKNLISMSLNNRKLSYGLAINEALHQMMGKDGNILLLGQGVKSPWYVGATCKDLFQKFGEERVVDTPVSENAMTGTAIGAALAGMKSIILYPRMDFMLYAIDPIINQAANWRYMLGGKASVPIVIWGIINRGGEQAAQHSQALQSVFAHIPGLKVVMPSNPYDAKGLMTSAIEDNDPVVFIDDRWLYGVEGEVPEETYKVPIGKGVVKKEGKDITLVATSHMVKESLEAAEKLKGEGIDVEVIDPRTIKPLDKDLILKSVEKTGRLVIVDGGWKSFGIGAEISASVSENILKSLKAPIKRVSLPDVPAPSSSVLEKAYYISQEDIIRIIKELHEL